MQNGDRLGKHLVIHSLELNQTQLAPTSNWRHGFYEMDRA